MSVGMLNDKSRQVQVPPSAVAPHGLLVEAFRCPSVKQVALALLFFVQDGRLSAVKGSAFSLPLKDLLAKCFKWCARLEGQGEAWREAMLERLAFCEGCSLKGVQQLKAWWEGLKAHVGSCKQRPESVAPCALLLLSLQSHLGPLNSEQLAFLASCEGFEGQVFVPQRA